MDGDILVRTINNLRSPQALALPPGELLDQRRVISSEIAKHILDANVIQRFEQVMGRGVSARVGRFVAVPNAILCSFNL